MSPNDVIRQLGYSEEPEYWITEDKADEVTSLLWRIIKDDTSLRKHIQVYGSYVFQTSPRPHSGDNPILPPRPVVHVLKADAVEYARAVRKKLWNLGTAPFLIVILPHQVRVHRGFDYDRNKAGDDAIKDSPLTPEDISIILKDFYASEIDSGHIWQTQADNLTPEKRVDQRLLKSLEDLGKELVTTRGVDQSIAHALIGKYIYIYYLRDRNILTDKWLEKYHISLENVIGKSASATHLQTLTEALEGRFQGKIFPLDFQALDNWKDNIVGYVAAIFRGDSTSGQLALDFQIYDFSCIPIELLSSIYEQFLRSEGKGKKEGAVYTREFVADYLLCELNSIKPLQQGIKILDPACGSGVFLVLAYRRLIEQALRHNAGRKLTPEELSGILEQSIYGVEPILDACYVTEFSLILMLLSYVEPPELHQNESFRFPDLHNTNIFYGDFFNDDLWIWQQRLKFNWVVGNPPWIELDTNEKKQSQEYAWDWMLNKSNSKHRPIGNHSLAEAFTWRSIDLLHDNGCIGLLISATSLFIKDSTRYRQEFFKQHEIRRITNFSNLAYDLFAKKSQAEDKQTSQKKPGAEAPGATIIYSKAIAGQEKSPIEHYAPFAINQILNQGHGKRTVKKPAWTITIYENEVQAVDPYEAEVGDLITWKLALWGTYRDKRAINRFKRLFPQSFEELRRKRNWFLHEGPQLRAEFSPSAPENVGIDNKKSRETRPVAGLDKRLNVTTMRGGFYLTVPNEALQHIPEEHHHIRVQGGDKGLLVSKAPHLFWSCNHAAYSNVDFALPPRRIGIAVPQHDDEYLRAFALYLNASVARYLLFFHSMYWGVDRSLISPEDCKRLPVPDLSEEQVTRLAQLHKELSDAQIPTPEADLFNQAAQTEHLTPEEIRTRIDDVVENSLNIPGYLRTIARDFMRVRYLLNKGKKTGVPAQRATIEDLYRYACYLRDTLDAFAGTHHKIKILAGSQFVSCSVEITYSEQPFEPTVAQSAKSIPEDSATLWEGLNQTFSQWVYIQRGLRVLEGKHFNIWKTPRLIDWTQTQALLDSDDIIAEVLNYKGDAP